MGYPTLSHPIAARLRLLDTNEYGVRVDAEVPWSMDMEVDGALLIAVRAHLEEKVYEWRFGVQHNDHFDWLPAIRTTPDGDGQEIAEIVMAFKMAWDRKSLPEDVWEGGFYMVLYCMGRYEFKMAAKYHQAMADKMNFAMGDGL